MTQSNQSQSKSAGKKWWALIAICFGLFMALLDVTIVNVALPTIQTELDADISSIEWVINAYTLVFAVTLVTVSRLGDIYGRKTFFMLGLAVFTLGSLLCAISGDIAVPGLSKIAVLNISRGIQGLGASAMLPLSLAILSATFTGKERGMAIGIWGAISGLATAIGPLVGGFLVEKVNWQSIFIINIPIGIIGILMAFWAISQSRDEDTDKTVDLTGLLIFTVFIFCLIFGLIQVNSADYSWTSPLILILFAISAIAIITFIFVELRLDVPMVDPRLFKNPSYTGAAIAAFTLSAGLYALFFYLTLYLQNFLGFSALEAGLRFLPLSALALLVGPFTGNFMSKWGAKPFVVTALVLMAIAVFLMTAVSPDDTQSSWLKLLPAFIIAGIGNGMINPAVSNLAVSTVSQNRVGMGSGVNNVCRQIGIAFGTAFLGALLSNRYAESVKAHIHVSGIAHAGQVEHEIQQGVIQAGPIAGSTGLKNAGEYGAQYANTPLFEQVQHQVQTAFLNGTDTVFWAAGTILAIGAVSAFFLIRKDDLKQ